MSLNNIPSPSNPENLDPHARIRRLMDTAAEALGARLEHEGPALTALVVPEEGWPTFHAFASMEALQQFITTHVGAATAVYAFLGIPLRITSGEFRYLATPYGTLPLFNVSPASDTYDEFLGERLPEVVVPDGDAVAAADDRVDSADDEFFDSDDLDTPDGDEELPQDQDEDDIDVEDA